MKDYVRGVLAQGHAEDCRGRRCRPGHARQNARPDVRRVAGQGPASRRSPTSKPRKPPAARVLFPLDVPQTVVTFGGPGIKRHDPNFMAGYVVNHILGGGGLSSRLYHEVREKRGLAYSVSESLLWMDHSAIFYGNTGTRADRAGETVAAIDKEIRRMAEDGPTQQELDEAKSYLKGSQMLALDTSSKLASALLQYQLDKLPIDYIEKRNAIVDAVTLDEAKKAARRLWGQGLLTVVVGRAPASRRPARGRNPRPQRTSIARPAHRVPDAVQRPLGGCAAEPGPTASLAAMDPGSAAHHAARAARYGPHPGNASFSAANKNR